jgi:hemerythrin-like metal-binding protein
MSHYTWDSSFETGHALVDGQHKQLVEALNNLVDAAQNQKGMEELDRVLEFLVAYTIKHFNDEEKLQKQYEYPEYMRHKGYHEAFKKEVAEFMERLQKEGANPDLLVEVYTRIGSWLVNHIKGEDFKMAVYVKTKEQN